MTECIIWTGLTNNRGYGVIKKTGRTLLAHRVVYEECFGIIPTGMVVMHSCDVRPCVNPLHLSLGTQAQNLRDMVEKNRHNPHQSLKTACPQGHEYTEENTYRPPGRNERQCRSCARDRARIKRQLQHAKASP